MAKVTRIKSKDRGPEKVKDARVVARVSSGGKTSAKKAEKGPAKKAGAVEKKTEKKTAGKVPAGKAEKKILAKG